MFSNKRGGGRSSLNYLRERRRRWQLGLEKNPSPTHGSGGERNEENQLTRTNGGTNSASTREDEKPE